MTFEFECKHCHRGLYRKLDELRSEPRLTCPGCGAVANAESLTVAIDGLIARMAELRQDFRLDLALRTDDLPAPHGFDADYTLPEEDGSEGKDPAEPE